MAPLFFPLWTLDTDSFRNRLQIAGRYGQEKYCLSVHMSDLFIYIDFQLYLNMQKIQTKYVELSVLKSRLSLKSKSRMTTVCVLFSFSQTSL